MNPKRIFFDIGLKVQALPEDINYSPERGLDMAVVADLLSCAWVWQQHNVLMTGPTGTARPGWDAR